MTRKAFGRFAAVVGMAASVLAGGVSPAAAQPVRPPVRPPYQNPNDLVEITSGDNHTCVRKNNGNVFCWGLDSGGELGVPFTNSDCNEVVQPVTFAPCVDKPVFVTQATTQIVAGGNHTCALSGGVASCWGSNAYGEIGDGTTITRSAPQNVAGAIQFTTLATGSSATCGLSSSGVFCWGQLPYGFQPNGSISLGAPHQFEALAPAQISSYTGYRSLTVGRQFACFAYVSGSWGEADCQGIDDSGQLGVESSWLPFDTYKSSLISSFNIPFAPFLVRSSLGVGSDGTPHISRSSAGVNFVCADIADGTVQCVGSNVAMVTPALGGASTATGGASTAPGPDLWKATTITNSQGAVLQLHGVTTGTAHACALDGSGSAWCWGSNGHGELGDGTATISRFFAVPVAGTLKFRALAAGLLHTCGIGTDNLVYCWGDNQDGQLGIGYNTLGLVNPLTRVTFTTTPHRLDPL